MPTIGAYEFKRAAKADHTGLIVDENEIAVGEWAWVDYTERTGGDKKRLLIQMRDPDCKMLSTIWQNFTPSPFTIDANGVISPSVHHKWPYGDPPVEHCGFHTSPTRLLGFVDRRALYGDSVPVIFHKKIT